MKKYYLVLYLFIEIYYALLRAYPPYYGQGEYTKDARLTLPKPLSNLPWMEKRSRDE